MTPCGKAEHGDITPEMRAEIEKQLHTIICLWLGIPWKRVKTCSLESVDGMPTKSGLRLEFDPELRESESAVLMKHLKAMNSALGGSPIMTDKGQDA